MRQMAAQQMDNASGPGHAGVSAVPPRNAWHCAPLLSPHLDSSQPEGADARDRVQGLFSRIQPGRARPRARAQRRRRNRAPKADKDGDPVPAIPRAA
jgi:hypothetical protein